MFDNWFVVPTEGEGGVHFLVHASDKSDALARFVAKRPDCVPEPVLTFEEYCDRAYIDDIDDMEHELRRQLGRVHPRHLSDGAVIMMA